MDWLLSVFEHFAKFNSLSAHKTYSPLGQVRHDKNHNTLELKGLSVLLFPFGTRFAFLKSRGLIRRLNLFVPVGPRVFATVDEFVSRR